VKGLSCRLAAAGVGDLGNIPGGTSGRKVEREARRQRVSSRVDIRMVIRRGLNKDGLKAV